MRCFEVGFFRLVLLDGFSGVATASKLRFGNIFEVRAPDRLGTPSPLSSLRDTSPWAKIQNISKEDGLVSEIETWKMIWRPFEPYLCIE